MSAVVRRWLRLKCTKCEQRRVFVVQKGWVLSCSQCGTQRRLAPNGLVATPRLSA
jgi:ribosomal protein S27E